MSENKDELTADNIEQVLTAMSQSFEDKDKQYSQNSSILNEFDNLPSPSQFNRIYFQKDREKDLDIKALLIHNEGLSKIDNNIVFVYKNFKLLKNIVAKNISNFEGGACSVDKTASILNLYVKNKINITKYNKEIDYDNYDQWNNPQLGSLSLWFGLVDSLNLFYYGFTDDFNNSIENLKKFYQ